MTEYERGLSKYLQGFLTPQRQAKFTEVLHQRTRQITVVLVDLNQSHNASAILRSCEAFGVQDVYVVEFQHRFETKREIAMGTDRWLTIHRFGGDAALDRCFDALTQFGYRTAATVLTPETTPISKISVAHEQPLAVFFGTEKHGLPEEVIERVDLHTHIPMYGFVESFNVSVAAALTLQNLTQRLKQESQTWPLSPQEQEELWLNWTRESINNCDALERYFQTIWEDHVANSVGE